ncbi:MAG: phosphomannomutase [bacterium]|nr:phosphomannomutase [bacterium]
MPNHLSNHPAFSAFKAYDIRGRVPQEVNAELFYSVGTAYTQTVQPKNVAIGHDIRLSSPQLASALAEALRDQGVNVTDLGLCGTEEIYYAVGHQGLDGGLMVTASHNPADYNGLKMVQAGARPLTKQQNTKIRDLALAADSSVQRKQRGALKKLDIHGSFIDYVLSLIELPLLPRLKVVCNAGNGGAGVVLEQLRARLPLEMIVINGEADGHFPNGVPNPLLPECRADTARAVREHHADLGVAWDGDFDRCFFFDERGRFVEGYYVVGLLAKRFLESTPGATVIYDPRLTWNTLEIAEAAQGQAVMSATGHAFIKQAMRDHQAVYGGEMSAHHYFRDFFFCDSGILPWLFVMELMGRLNQPLSALVDDMIEKHPISGEINRRTAEPLPQILERLRQSVSAVYGPPLKEDTLDGLSWEYEQFRFNVRASNTEPLVRLNAETRAGQALLQRVTQLLLEAIGGENP